MSPLQSHCKINEFNRDRIPSRLAMVPFRNTFDSEFLLVSQGRITKLKRTLLHMLKFNHGIII